MMDVPSLRIICVSHFSAQSRLRLRAWFAVMLAATWAHAAELHPAAALVERATTAMRTDPELSRRGAEEALRVLSARADADLEIRAHLLLCDYYSERDNGLAEKQQAAAAALLAHARHTALRAGVLNCEGAIKEADGDNENALQLYRQAVEIATAANDDELLADALFARGYLLGLKGEYTAGLDDLQKSQALYERIKKSHHALTVLNSIATLYNRMGDYAQAKHIYERALAAQRAAGMRREIAVTQHNLARAHENLHEWSAAREAYAEALRIAQTLNYTRGQAYALRGLAAVANATGDARTALELLEQAQTFQKEVQDARLSAQIDHARGVALHLLDRLNESAAALERAADVFRRADSLNELSPTYTELAAVYAAMNNWRKAYDYRLQAQTLAEQLLRNQLDQRFAALKIQFDTTTKEKENALLLRENEANRKTLAQQRIAGRLQTVVIVLAALLLVLLVVVVVHQRRRTRSMRVLAMTDELTSMPNRRAALARLSLILASGRSKTCSLLIIDIDHFKSINDTYGHPIGDETLKLVAAKLRETVCEPAFVGRLGGEEFVLVLPNTTLESAARTAESLRAAVSCLDLSSCRIERSLTVSIGVTASVAQDSVSALLRRADAALYAAKHGGRDCVRTEAAETSAVPDAAARPRLVANLDS